MKMLVATDGSPMGDMIVVDAHIEVDATISVEAGTTSPWRPVSACCNGTVC